MPHFVKSGRSVAKILRFFDLSRWRLEIVNFHLPLVSAGPRRMTVLNFVKIGRFIAVILHFFKFSRRPPPPSWIFETAINFIGYCAKFCQNRSIGRKGIKIFDFSRWQPSPSWIFEIVNFYLLTVSRGLRRITVPNFVKIGPFVADILRLFEFSRWPSPRSWIFEIAKFYWLLRS